MSDRPRALPASFESTRDALHLLAEKVVAPARAAATGEAFSLQASAGGFGTPRLPDGSVIRVEAAELVVESARGQSRRQAISSLEAAANFVGLEGVDLDDSPLSIDAEAAAVLGAVFAFANDVLGDLRGEAAENGNASPIRLWPEHFDIAFEQGDEAAGKRAGYGVSPGDDHHAAPYFYVGPWEQPVEPSGWNGRGFTGAELLWEDLLRSPDQRATALAFLRGRRDALEAGR